MRVFLEAFDDQTDLLAEDFDITNIGLDTIAEILGVEVDELALGYDLTDRQLMRICKLAGIEPNQGGRSFQVGGAADE
ncbi:DUF7683 domain-containing protein [Nocardia caishijiensis]|uniref:DUF7683 domain-containing protein n=1 Tax=Nocardia caishijiensis TaxID=184756 RepID=A0ABQ6YED2_9NOCA|nr:hypothetical protein FNL39_11722 [Nocardia caishijiensis]